MPDAVSPCVWAFPDPRTVGRDGFVAVGADLEPGTLVHAYRQGIFPWPHGSRKRLPWFSPEPRAILPLDRLYVAKSLRQRLRRCGWAASVDHAFSSVIAACASPHHDGGTWITAPMRAAYTELHRLGWAHSVEIWDGSRLVGGLYGVLVGGVFTGESMFHHETDASKVAVVELVARMGEAGGAFIDVQLPTPHLASLGALAIARSLYLDLLAECRDDEIVLATDRRPVIRHVAPST